MASSIYQVLKRPLVTEKTNAQRDAHNDYTFEVATDANKVEIKQAVETLFSVRVKSVRTAIIRGHYRRTRRGVGQKPNWKKAVVTLHEGHSIELFEGV
ncbi:MAG TPA: 50S ribosomal protein L23 [Myxococcota bacterium]|jgi:large subunit ribosomal protein L23|nr:50S ribosomal protein L23 [Myxococcota bacterium]